MEVNINGDPIEIKGEFSSIADIIKKLIEIVRSNKRTITSVSIDDGPIDHRDPSSLNIPYEGQNIYVITEDTDKVLERTLNDTIEYLRDKLLDGIMDLSMDFREDKIKEGSKNLSIIFESCYYLVDLIDFISKHGIFNDTDINLNDFQISDFVSFLKEVMDAQEIKDHILVADLLEYEVHPLMANWLELFLHIKEII